ncbi:MAG: hypothetical protein EOM54_00615 [Clostridia bacterium]|nr:hypothetical protein [Clostridia bacterium]
MKVEIVRADPTGNATILVLSPVRAEERAETAALLMELDGGWAEQVGFVSKDGENDRLDMMGGEFCGNASMSLAAFLADCRGFAEARVPLVVSGAPERVLCSVVKKGEDWLCSVDMPLPESLEIEEFTLDGEAFRLWTARFPGILHVIVPEAALSREDAEIAVRKWADDTGAPALGILIFSREKLEMAPLVYVRATDSAVWERGCASGTSAIGAYLAISTGESAAADIRQPGGVIGIEAAAVSGRATALRISGKVRMLGKDYPEI